MPLRYLGMDIAVITITFKPLNKDIIQEYG
jgi:hypothetical protein